MSELEDEFEDDDEFMIDDPEPLGASDQSDADITDSSSEYSTQSDSDSWDSDFEGERGNQRIVLERGRGTGRGRRAGGRRGRARVLVRACAGRSPIVEYQKGSKVRKG